MATSSESVAVRGVEGALEQLRDAGVYLTLEEFKRMRPIVDPASPSSRMRPISTMPWLHQAAFRPRPAEAERPPPGHVRLGFRQRAIRE